VRTWLHTRAETLRTAGAALGPTRPQALHFTEIAACTEVSA
jgi:hypothetical protein